MALYPNPNSPTNSDEEAKFENRIYEDFYRPQQRAMLEEQRRHRNALKAIKKLQQTTAWRTASANQRFEMLVQVAAKNTQGNGEAIAAAFQAINRRGPFGRSVHDDLAGLVIPSGKGHGSATGADKAEHVLMNADLGMKFHNSSLSTSLLTGVGDTLERIQPLIGGRFDTGDMQANRAGIELGAAIEKGKVDLTRFSIGDIP